ncbi:hypothetical protein GS492_09790 [Rhodococcus hoagii]|nr:hypothetical protein [Prescottella equi]
MSGIVEANKQIRFDADGITVGGERVPGAYGNRVIVRENTDGTYEVDITFLTHVPPVTAPGLVDEPITTRVIRPALPGDD